VSGRVLPLADSAEVPWDGGVVTERATCVLAGNPGPMTLDGTNTWVLAEPGSSTVVVLDPGPDDGAHLDAIDTVVDGRAVGLVLLTHGHPDHAEAALPYARRVGAPVAALDPAHRLGSEGLVDGDRLEVGGVVVDVVATPGHTADSLSFHLVADGALLTGDTVLGRGSTVVAHPDGRLADYLHSLHRLARLAAETDAAVVLPGHGPAVSDPAGAVAAYLEHREARLQQVRHALEAGAVTADDVVAQVYADVPREVWPAARLSVLAQLAYLDRD
jgi:glyoxylase-like metal-dependent hydrolase (beta-lactamase superfamily II)